MKGTQIGEFEELVLLTIATLGEKAYGVAIKDEIESRMQRQVSIGSLHSTITRLEEKGFLIGEFGKATAERGGRRKRYFQITKNGKVALHKVKDIRDQLWAASNYKLALD